MADENPYAPPTADVDVESPMHSELAGRWARLGGALIDGIILMVAILAILFPMGYWDRAMADSLTLGDDFLVFGLSMILYLVINGYTLANRGQTIGKILAGTRIISNSDGRLLPLWKIFALRHLPVSAVGLVPVVGGIIVIINILLVFREDRRCGHDLIAGTRVVRADSIPAKP